MANLEFENLEENFKNLFNMKFEMGKKKQLAIDMYSDAGIGKENVPVKFLYNTLNDIMLNTFAHTGIGEYYQLPAGIELKNPTQETLIRDSKTFEKFLIEQVENLVNASVTNRAVVLGFQNELEKMYESYTTDVFTGSLLERIEHKRISPQKFGTFIEKNYFASYTRGKASDPRADIFDLALEIKTTGIYKKKSELNVGSISGIFSEYFHTEDSAGNITKAILKDEEKLVYNILITTYKTVLKMRNLLLIFTRNISAEKGRIGFQEIDLFTLIKAKRVYDEIKKELTGHVSDIISVDITPKKSAINKKTGKKWVKNTITYEVKFKMPTSDELIAQAGAGKPFLEMEQMKIKELYQRQIDLLSIARKPSQERFRRALFGLLRYRTQRWARK